MEGVCLGIKLNVFKIFSMREEIYEISHEGRNISSCNCGAFTLFMQALCAFCLICAWIMHYNDFIFLTELKIETE